MRGRPGVSSVQARRPLKRSAGRFARDRRGASAVEFSILAPVFLAMMMSTFEIGWFYFVNSTVDGATLGISRQIRTGQIQGGAGFSKNEFFDEVVCPRLSYFGDCSERVTAEVMLFDSFADLAIDNSPTTCRDDNPEDVENIVVDPGTELQIVRVRICLIYRTLNPAIGLNLATTEGGERRVTSTYIFRNEPYLQNIRDET
ncbi:MAG: TadE/TadG family type IV pilus assembly protein [Pseudomonadota bacterium]